MPNALTKRTKAGELYTRPPVVESELEELEQLDRSVLVERCKIRNKGRI